MSNEALGMAEARGLVGAIEVVDITTKVVNVALIGYEKTGSGLVTVIVYGDADAVKVSVDVGVVAATNVGQIVSQHIVLKPHTNVEKILPKSLQCIGKYIPANTAGLQTSERGQT